MKVLVVYTTNAGSTGEVADAKREIWRKLGESLWRNLPIGVVKLRGRLAQ